MVALFPNVLQLLSLFTEYSELKFPLLGGSTIGHTLKVRDMGPDAAHEEGVGRIPPQGGPQDYGSGTVEGKIGRLGLPSLEEAMAEAGLQEVETYISRLQNTVTQYIVTRLIMDLFLAAKRMPGPRVATRWREQEGCDL